MALYPAFEAAWLCWLVRLRRVLLCVPLYQCMLQKSERIVCVHQLVLLRCPCLLVLLMQMLSRLLVHYAPSGERTNCCCDV